ncbi:MAG: ABC transporter substrate-binding protein [Chitinophagaceae bacterium]|nr:ABC transporter substrate-binding protein [Chitinophagaceae bacterium]
MKFIKFLLFSVIFISCKSKNDNVPTIAFVDAFEDNTIAKAKQGFFDALKKDGFSEEQQTINVIYRNAQGNIPTLTQIIQYAKSEKVSLIATCPSISTITAIQNIKDIPVFMMVSPKPELMKINAVDGRSPTNLYGVGEDLSYIDTSFGLIPKLLSKKEKIKVGMIFNQSEPQSVDALNRIKTLAQQMNIELVSLPVNSSAETQLVTQSLLSKNIDAFFANPDNVVFASFETIIQACNHAKVPVFTSEAGLVARGAVAAYGADMYAWGYQAGEQAAEYLKTKSTKDLQWQMVKKRTKVYNSKVALQFGITLDSSFESIN